MPEVGVIQKLPPLPMLCASAERRSYPFAPTSMVVRKASVAGRVALLLVGLGLINGLGQIHPSAA
jgi:hypothetical protein